MNITSFIQDLKLEIQKYKLIIGMHHVDDTPIKYLPKGEKIDYPSHNR